MSTAVLPSTGLNQGFVGNQGLGSATPPYLPVASAPLSPTLFPCTEKVLEPSTTQCQVVRQEVQQPLQQQGGFGQIALKPICIEQEPVTFRPGPLTIQQPPLVVQGETITIPQPPIVIHPEPIVIPQAPLTFTPQAITMNRAPITVQPEPITLQRPSYSVQPVIQYDLRGCNRFGMPDFSQHVHVCLSNEQAGINQQALGSQLQHSIEGGLAHQQGSNLGGGMQNTGLYNQGGLATSSNYNAAPFNTNAAAPVKSNMMAADRDYNYGLPPSKTDKAKDMVGVSNYGPQKPVVL